MKISRREFLKKTAAIAGAAIIGKNTNSFALEDLSLYQDRYGVLVDTTFCNGCRRCEWACNEWNKNPNRPIKTFENKTVFNRKRRTGASTFTVVNRFTRSRDSRPIYVKKQCMHCEEPACLSACFVDAFKKTKKGAVIYNPALCVGCRYCMVACPFDIPAYEYYEPLNPRVTKCTFCIDRISKEGRVPACVEICPTETLRFGKRKDLINLAHERIRNNPRKYVDHVYGEHEVGGTSWLYLSSVPFEEIGFRTDLGKGAIPNLSKGFLFMTKVFEVIAAWPLVFAAFYTISKMRNRLPKGKSKVEETKSDQNGQKN
ncbi:MAG: 4Fe-4S dicluster domain-containing protein [Nitrospirota bacterium]